MKIIFTRLQVGFARMKFRLARMQIAFTRLQFTFARVQMFAKNAKIDVFDTTSPHSQKKVSQKDFRGTPKYGTLFLVFLISFTNRFDQEMFRNSDLNDWYKF
ncbi:hypothetical protein [Parapedobacter sp. 10938]|uniref:hypothetical protein n=1 Tax=Parapedobacter flavus TaxID=3110225 RepID=UPI002DBB168B|nr:hypothetical protein [Parapedobacter sp. 10938]